METGLAVHLLTYAANKDYVMQTSLERRGGRKQVKRQSEGQ